MIRNLQLELTGIQTLFHVSYFSVLVSFSQSPLDEPVVLTDEVIFPLTVSLDKLPVSTLKVKVCHFGRAEVELSFPPF